MVKLSGFTDTGGGLGPVTGPPKPKKTITDFINDALRPVKQTAATPQSLPARNGAVVPISQTYTQPSASQFSGTSNPDGGYGSAVNPAVAGGDARVGAAGSSSQTGYAANYRPAFDATVAYDHPEILARDVLASMGINDPVLAAQLAANGDFATLAAFLSGNSGGTSDAAVINYLGNYFKNQGTVGGATPDTGALLGAILNAGGDPNGAIAQYLGLGSTVANPNALANVTKITNATIQNALNDQNPYTQRAMQNYLGQLGSNYASLQAHGAANMPDYATYLRTHGVGGFVR